MARAVTNLCYAARLSRRTAYMGSPGISIADVMDRVLNARVLHGLYAD